MSNEIIKKFVNKFREDGGDHIRISPFAETTLGKVLSPDWRKKFFIPHVGEFLTPQCFANWLVTGNDDARHDINIRPSTHIKDYSNFVLYSKYYQLCSMKTLLEKEYKDLPFAMYKVHTTGVKEHHRWKEYPLEVKEMVEHILDPERGSKTPYPWDKKYPGLAERVNEHIKEIVQRDSVTKPPSKPVPAPPKTIKVIIEELSHEDGLSDEEIDRRAEETLKRQYGRELSDDELDSIAQQRLNRQLARQVGKKK